jgi:gliding motility-associated-like protein
MGNILQRVRSVFKFLPLFFLLAFIPDARAQLNVTPGVSASTLVTNLLGSSMTVSNIVLNCPSNAYGTFANGNTTNMGITNGIILTTGSATNAIGPNNSTSAGTCNGNNLNDPQLQSLDPLATHDPCILEFDIIPQCNTLQIRFVFGSEEYPEFVSSGFNDAFGFWLTGPGPACQSNYYNNTNVATLPNNTTIVSIDNVNQNTNSAYFVPNQNGATIQYDGFTTVLTRTVSLCPCQTYHWKIAIADAGDCVYDSGVFIDFLSCSTALSATTTSSPATCMGCNGTATAMPIGTGPFTYSWAPSGGNSQTATGLCPGTYTCTVDDAVSCSPPATVTVVVGSSAAPITASASPTNVTCNGACDGIATATPTSGTGPYTYSWSSGGTAATETGLCPGSYTCAITDANGCTGNTSVTITQPSIVLATSAGTNVSCYGGSNGTAFVNPSGGTGAYTFSWAPSGGNAATATNLAAGTYTCTVADANGCTTTTSLTITEPPAFTASAVGTDISCFGGTNGSATVSTNGGSGGNVYSWSPSGGSLATENNLAAGTYTCTVTDVAGCIATSSITLTEPPALVLAPSALPATCFSACDGQLDVVTNGGVQPYNFSWNTGCTTPACTNICAGSYSITVTDANGCTATNSVTVTEPTAIAQNLSSTPANCNASDGTASTVVNGGTGPYNFNWQPGNGTTSLYSNIPAGQYTVTVTDANGCISVDSVVVGNAIGLNILSSPVTNVSCFSACDGSLTATGNGATPPYSYAWSPSGGNASTASNLCPGSYTCTVTDANGCWNTASFTVTEPTQLSVTTPAVPPKICNGASTNLSAVAAGGTPAYSYLWQPGALAGSSPLVNPTTTTTYTVTATDANGCTSTATEIIIVNPTPVALFGATPLSGCVSLDVDFTDLSTIAAPGVITTWNWEFGDNTSDVQQNPPHTYLNPGTYTVTLTVTTADGCTSTLTLNNYITVYPNPVAGFSESPQPTTVLEPTVNFTDESTGAASWQWFFGDVQNSFSTLQNPSFAFPDTGCYLVQQVVTTSYLCRDTAEAIVCIQPDWTVYIPNAFTPNNDGVNDIFMPSETGIAEGDFEMWIFDRWGNQLFYTSDLHKGWDGKAKGGAQVAQVDTYVYKIKCKDTLGISHKYIGKVSLLR